MTGTELKQRLAAILAADVAGYSRLMAADDLSTVAALDTARSVFKTRIESNHGRIIDMAGDSVLAVFETATGAVTSALAVQQELNAWSSAVPEDRRMRFRIGVHLGDVIEKADGTVYGDGVNIAARLQALAEIGGITISDAVQGAVRGKVAASFVDQGEQQVKNIPYPVRAFAVRSAAGAPDTIKPVGRLRRSWKPWIAAVVSIVLMALGGLLYRSQTRLATPPMSVVVLPFTNATGDPNQEYVADAITEEITVQLSKIKGSFVIGRNTAFAFKGKTTDLKAIAKELNVRYVLQGTAARSENGFHVTTELVDGTTGSNLWADTFDAGLDRVGNIRREVVARLTVALRLELISAEARKAEGRSNPDATDLTMRAWAKNNQGFTKENTLAALDLFEKALQVQPEFEPALVGRGGMRISLATAFPGPNKNQQLLDAERDGLRAISLDASDPRAYFLIGQVRTFQARTEEAILAIDEAIDLNPNFPGALAQRGLLMFLNGQAALAFEPLQKALELSPLDPSRGIWLSWVCHAYIHLGKHSDAVSWCEKSASLAPFWLNLSDLVAAYTALGDVEKAEAAKAKLLKIQPDFSITWIKNLNLSNNPVWRKQAEENFWSYERKAGIPD